MSRLLFGGVVVGLVLTACSSGGDIDGMWLLETVSVPAEGETVVYDGTAADAQPWIKLTPSVEGHTGCNTFNQAGEPSATWDGQHLSTIRFFQTASGCSEPTRTIEEAFTNTMRYPDGIDVTFADDGDIMVWESPTGVVITFRREA